MRNLKSYFPLFRILGPLIFERRTFENPEVLRETLEHNKKLIVVMNHSTPMSWLPAMTALSLACLEVGQGDRRPHGVMDRFFYQVPGLKHLAQFLTQFDHPTSFEELRGEFMAKDQIDLVILPEGSNCFFEPPGSIEQFRSLRFLELAHKTKTPILVCIHRGSEHWGQEIAVPERLERLLSLYPGQLWPRLRKTQVLTVPVWPKKISHFRMKVFSFKPDLKNSQDMSLQHLQRESERLLLEMQEAYRALF